MQSACPALVELRWDQSSVGSTVLYAKLVEHRVHVAHTDCLHLSLDATLPF
jgi:hypothetical protein